MHVLVFMRCLFPYFSCIKIFIYVFFLYQIIFVLEYCYYASKFSLSLSHTHIIP